MKLQYSREAIKNLRNIDNKIAKEIKTYMNLYTENPYSLPPKKIKKLTGNLQGYNRLRVGDYRAVFSDNGESVIVVRIGHRKEVYD